jgi:hypothetical protein
MNLAAEMRRPNAWLLSVPFVLGIAAPGAAQDLEPRAYSPSPIGTTFVVVSATRSAGGVFTDTSSPITDVEATVGVLGLALGHTFSLAGKQALVLGVVPIAWGEATGSIGEDRRSASRRGLGDSRVKLSTILAGSPAMRPAEFAKAPRRTIVGVSLTVGAPTGQYDGTKLVNLGAHRWALKPEIGMSYPAGRWTLDAYAGVWFFTDNDEYYPGASIRHQDAIKTLQGHVSYTLGRRAWVAVNGTWYSGGQSRIDGVGKADLQRNSRIGATLAVPIGTRQSLKVAYSTGATTRVGADFRTLTFAWQYVFF